MYTRCLFCSRDLGRNEAIEAFPVGRRLAFDAARLGAAGVLTVGAATAAVAGVALPLAFLSTAVLTARRLTRWAQHGVPLATVAHVATPRGRVRVRRRDLLQTRLLPDAGGEMRIQVAHAGGTAELAGEEARRAAAVLLPAANWLGGGPDDVRRAVARLEHAGDAERFVRDFARRGPRLTAAAVDRRTAWMTAQSGHPPGLPRDDGEYAETGLLAVEPSLRLAVEMALHEEQERRALDGELAKLERAWREAEAVAAIADALTLPTRVEHAFVRLRGSGADRPAG